MPHARSVVDDTVDEERRLAYVGITRARHHLTITWTKTRSRHGHRMESMPSRFLFEMREKKPPKGWVAAGEERPVKKKPTLRRGRGRQPRRVGRRAS